MKPIYIVLIIIAMLIALVLLFAIAYTYTAAYQQTLSAKVPFDNTYLYGQNLENIKIDYVKIVVTGNIKHSPTLTIIDGNLLKELIQKHIIYPNKNSIFIYENDMYREGEYNDKKLKYHAWNTIPSLETFSVSLFKTFNQSIRDTGCQLVSVNIVSNGIKVSHHRYKVSNYKLPPKI